MSVMFSIFILQYFLVGQENNAMRKKRKAIEVDYYYFFLASPRERA